MDDLYTEANRQLTICNSCRYCEGYCAVFPALERRTLLETGDITHLADLCHDCRACFTACMYAPPHEFALNPPAVLSEVRRRTYASYLPRLPGLSCLRRPAGDSGAASGSEVAGRSGAPGDGAGAADGSGVTGTPRVAVSSEVATSS